MVQMLKALIITEPAVAAAPPQAPLYHSTSSMPALEPSPQQQQQQQQPIFLPPPFNLAPFPQLMPPQLVPVAMPPAPIKQEPEYATSSADIKVKKEKNIANRITRDIKTKLQGEGLACLPGLPNVCTITEVVHALNTLQTKLAKEETVKTIDVPKFRKTYMEIGHPGWRAHTDSSNRRNQQVKWSSGENEAKKENTEPIVVDE